MKEKLETIKKQAKERIEEIKDLQALNELKVKILGKKGELTELLRWLPVLSPEGRPKKKRKRIIKTKRIRKKTK